MVPRRHKGRSGVRDPLDLQALIRLRYRELPANQRKIADYLLHHLLEAPFNSVVDLEQKTGASRSTVVRFARSLGFSGFLEMRSRLLESVQCQMQLSESYPFPDVGDGRDTLTLVAQQDVTNINETIKQLEKPTFGEIAEMFVKSSRVYTAGLGISSLMAQILAYLLNQVAIRATAFVHDYETFMEQLAFVTPDDVLVAFSFPPYSRETIDLVKAAAERSIPVIAVTDRLTSPVSFYATKVLAIRSQNMLFTNSFSAISVVMNALATEVAVRNKEKALKMTREVDGLLRATGHYATD
jgi:DNA-binding MurR/RpiR family transcriptional regulator